MKTVGTILKVFAALAAVAGAIYVAVTYGYKIVAWVKKVFLIPGIPVIFYVCMCNIQCMEAEETLSQVDEPFRPDFAGWDIIPQINHFLSFFHVVQKLRSVCCCQDNTELFSGQ